MVWVNKVGVVGAGTMGHGIAEVLAYSGLDVVLLDVDRGILDRAFATIEAILHERVTASKMTEDEKQEILARITRTTDYKDLGEVDYAIEAAPEDMALKAKVFRELDERVPDGAVLATNTSALSVAAIGASTKRAPRVIGMHFFNPAHKMKLVEIVPSVVTAQETVDETVELAERCRKIAVVVKDTPGFLVNRILTPILIESIRALDEGVASQRDIDIAMRAGAGFPMGVFELADLVGLDTALEVADTMHRETGDPRYAPPPRLRRMVEAGLLGKKSGRGFYEYS